MSDGWADDIGVMALPGGPHVRGRRLSDVVGPASSGELASRPAATFCLVLARGEPPPWPHRRIRWPDFWVPLDRADAIAALREAHRRAYAGERVEVACRGGVGRTGTALAALSIMDGLDADEALARVRAGYHHRAVETPWQRAWLRRLARDVAAGQA